MLIWHVDHFKSTTTERGRSPVVEEYLDPTVEASEALVVFAAAERDDEAHPEAVAQKGVDEIAKLARNLKATSIVLVPFAHLFAELASPEAALGMLRGMEAGLLGRGFQVSRVPFGWFNTLEIRAKGHPVSRVARTVRV